MTYNGHKNWDYWNVSLWINNSEDLYFLAKDLVNQSKNITEAAKLILEYLPEKTPDGAKYTIDKVRQAIRDIND